jgi:hypothetical protein
MSASLITTTSRAEGDLVEATFPALVNEVVRAPSETHSRVEDAASTRVFPRGSATPASRLLRVFEHHALLCRFDP